MKNDELKVFETPIDNFKFCPVETEKLKFALANLIELHEMQASLSEIDQAIAEHKKLLEHQAMPDNESKVFEVPYSEKVYGVIRVLAKTKEDALEKIGEGDCETEETDRDYFEYFASDIREA